MTDLFVEKALAYLEEQAARYRNFGLVAYIVGFAAVVYGSGLAIDQLGSTLNEARSWLTLASRFARAFTAYGMLILVAVGAGRFGKALLDQAERLMERRHALRQGRLFVHLCDGVVSIEDMEKAFNWNVSQPNAFTQMVADWKAPWGVVATEMAKVATEGVKAGVGAVVGRPTAVRPNAPMGGSTSS